MSEAGDQKRRSPMRWLIFVPPAVFGVLVGLFLFGMYRDDPESLPSTMVGRMAPALQVGDLGGAPLTTPEVLAAPGVKLVNFWASWCAPCRAEHPFLTELAQAGVPIHGINYKDKPDQALGFLDELGNPYATMGADPTGRTAIEWGVYGVPETYVLDSAGRVLLRHAGPITRQEYDRTIRPALDAAR
ncbi:cytochrome c biogenesis protein CcmG, thiol:disulfide interchange protein DsbE [Gemmobacter megaterium]|uniref:Cytochrome c biogenesis protein CcmG, thiol:disulfide interchange protein DsbE n=1 Tax=Gemmobacter megaterium TaxID=1086013 RepID=A0A1N7L127_9RHOB|nr:DsbE family thiol:disulfide interchange protein [Gemmobacter megaterium]GGE04985.1 thiol:disulfide interchange protein [Gemmobacter megaterium]SIS67446.1 cytochrome c biogenesis protein CcmG, thiol:disulfide interchange protein DsbE [Gemmobacter megaterium]